jgi:hypothetical protein
LREEILFCQDIRHIGGKITVITNPRDTVHKLSDPGVGEKKIIPAIL